GGQLLLVGCCLELELNPTLTSDRGELVRLVAASQPRLHGPSHSELPQAKIWNQARATPSSPAPERTNTPTPIAEPPWRCRPAPEQVTMRPPLQHLRRRPGVLEKACWQCTRQADGPQPHRALSFIS